MVADHFVPNKDITSAEQSKFMREFALEQGIMFYDVGQMGIEHCLLPEKGLVLPGDVSLARTRIPVPTAQSVLLLPAWVPPILPPQWPR